MTITKTPNAPRPVLPIIERATAESVRLGYNSPAGTHESFERTLKTYNPVLSAILGLLPEQCGVAAPLRDISRERAILVYGLLHRQAVVNIHVPPFRDRIKANENGKALIEMPNKLLLAAARIGRLGIKPNYDGRALPRIHERPPIEWKSAQQIIGAHDVELDNVIGGNVIPGLDLGLDADQHQEAGRTALALYAALDGAARASGYNRAVVS